MNRKSLCRILQPVLVPFRRECMRSTMGRSMRMQGGRRDKNMLAACDDKDTPIDEDLDKEASSINIGRIRGKGGPNGKEKTKNWSRDEDALLKEAVEKCGAGQWTAIAMYMNSNRTNEACRERWTYMESKEAQVSSKYEVKQYNLFTTEEDEKIINAMRTFQKAKKRVSWKVVSEIVGSKNTKQCQSRWRNLCKYRPDKIADIMKDRDVLFRYNRFEAKTDQELIRAIKVFQQEQRKVSWKKVAELVGSKNTKQCQSRWTNLCKYHSDKIADIMKDRSILFGKWLTVKDGEKLINAVLGFRQAGQKVSWNEVAEQVGSKDAEQCQRCWARVEKYHPERIAAAMTVDSQ